MMKLFRRLGLTTIFAISLGLFGVVIFQAPANANGEKYTWKDNNTITVSGGDLRKTVELKLQPGGASGIIGPGYTGPTDISDVFVGDLVFSSSGKDCKVGVRVLLFKSSGNGSGLQWNPPPYGPVVGSPGGIPDCSDSLQSSTHNKNISIGGTRPGDPNNSSETPEQKQIRVTVYAPDPLSTAPKEDTITIKKLDGTVVATQTIPLVDDSGAADWPPDQTPVAGHTIFENMAPDTDYLICDTYVAKECKQVHKKKTVPLSVELGTPFQTPNQKRIHLHVEYHAKRPCGSTLTVNPMTIEVTGPDGTVYDKKTETRTSEPNPNEEGAICDVDVTLGFEVFFDNMPPGQYQACATGAQCTTGNKVDGEELEMTLVIQTEQDAPPDQPICMTGDGIAGALAWIACPFVELIAKATDIFERNIIIPFMTISPLTTNDKNPIYALWKNLRDVANVGFVLLMLYSIISIALSKYNMKRVFPRLLLVALGINLSYFIVAFVIDAFNIFGGGLSQLLMGALTQAGTTMPADATSSTPVQSLFVVGGAALLAVIVTGGAAIGWLFGVLGIAFLFVLLIIIVLIIRQIAIVMLVILAPVAILMYLLPNTESIFKRWRSNLINLLMMYPLMVLVFAAGKILGILIMQPDFKIGAITGFATLLELPYHYLAQATDGITDQVSQGVRVILWFAVNAIAPGAGLPIIMAMGGAVTGKPWGWMKKRFVQSRINRSKDELSLLGKEARAKVAQNPYLPGLNRLAGHRLKKDAIMDARMGNLQHTQEEYLAEQMAKSSRMQRQASGVGGSAGRTRAAAGAAAAASKATSADIDNEMELLEDKMHEIAIDEETMADKIADYIENPTATNAVITGANGKTFNLATEGRGLQRALLNSAAKQGHVTAIEAARMNPNMDQTLVDDIIRRNETTLKNKGGHHLATDFNLAAGRGFDVSSAAGRNQARVQMHAQRLTSMANSGQNTIAGMKYGMLSGTAEMLDSRHFSADPATNAAQVAHRSAVLAAMDPNDRRLLREKMGAILNPRNASTLAKADVSREVFEDIQRNM